jgi:GT2 family glycosyltransferase
VELIRHEVNQGVSGARNTGIRAARGEFVAFLDPDDLFLPDHLKSAMGMLTGVEADVTCAPVESFRDGPGGWTHKAWFTGWRLDRFPSSLAVYNFIQPSAVVVRRSALMALNGFDTTPAIQHIEDYDLWIRLVEAGYRFAFMSSISARYRKHAGGATGDEEKFKQLHAVLFAKHPDFFREGHRRMMRVAHEDEAHAVELRSGPLVATILWVDALLVRILRKLGLRSS